MTILLSITDWDRHFENNRTREIRQMTWLPLPVKLDGDGYTEILDHVNGAAHFGAWIAILEVAAKCDTRGTLLRGNRNGVRCPHDAISLSRLTRIPVEILQEAIPRLVAAGWITAVQLPDDRTLAAPPCGDSAPSCGIPAPRASRATGQNSTEQERREEGVSVRDAREEHAACQPELKTGAPPPDPDPPAPKNGNGRTKGREAFDPLSVPLPAILDTPAFRAAWEARVRERAERAPRDRLRPEQTAAKLAKLAKLAAKWGVDAATDCVTRATAAGWTGEVFAEDEAGTRRGSGNGGTNGTARRPTRNANSAPDEARRAALLERDRLAMWDPDAPADQQPRSA